MTALARDATGTCPCQWGPSTHCARGDHGQCRAGTPAVYPAAWITDTSGSVWTPAPSNDVQVWRVGRACRWVCACPDGCHTRPRPKPKSKPRPSPAEPVQDALWELP